MLDILFAIVEAITSWLTTKEAIVWWLTIEVIGAIAFPIAFLAFRFLPDRGYSFSKMLGLLLMSFLLWIGASLHVIPNARWAIVMVLAIILTASGVLAYRMREDMVAFIKSKRNHLLVIDLFFTLAFIVALFLRSYSAGFNMFSEDWMNNGIINAIIRSDHFPPKDVWLSGHTINYPYFGHLSVATLTTLTDVPSRITFNLSVALFTALAAVGVFGIVYNLIIEKARFATTVAFAILAALFLLVLSNIEGLFELLAAHGVGSISFYNQLDIVGLDGPRESNAWYPTEPFWWGRAIAYATVFPDRLFPFARLLEGELHSEILAFPFVALVLGLALNMWRSAESTASRFLGIHPLDLALLALALGGLIMTHVWDGPTYLFVLVAVFALRSFLRVGRLNLRWLGQVGAFAIGLAVLAVLFFLPFYSTNFGAFKGIEFTAPQTTSATKHLLYMWLPALTLATVLAIAVMRDARRFLPASLLVLAPILLVALPWAGNLVINGGPPRLFDEIGDRGGDWIAVFVAAAVLFLILMALFHQLISGRDEKRAPEAVFVLVLGAVAVLLIIGPEFYWARDTFFVARLNTLNKAAFQSWWLISIAGSVGLYYFLRTVRQGGVLSRVGAASLGGVVVIVLAAGFIYPVLATYHFTGSFNTDSDRPLDGLLSIEANDREAILWLLSEVDGTPTVLEAVLDSHTIAARVSSYSGLPTVLGWPGHEFQWRGSYEPQGTRWEDVKQAYDTADIAVAQSVLDRYDVEYVYVGPLEREQYSEAGLAKFSSFMDIVYQNDAVTIYQIRSEGTTVALGAE